jgi:hypothetical protein
LATLNPWGVTSSQKYLPTHLIRQFWHAYAHADYVIWNDGIRICGKHLSDKRIVSFSEFQALVNQGAKFIVLLRSLGAKYVTHYSTPRVIEGSLARIPGHKTLVSYCSETGEFTIESYFSENKE